MKGYGYALSSVLLVTVAQLAMKWGMAGLPAIADPAAFLPGLCLALPATAAVATGLLCYVLSMGSWYFALKTLPLSTAYPLLSLSYVLVWLAAVALPAFPDSFSLGKVFAIALILGGVWLVTGKGR